MQRCLTPTIKILCLHILYYENTSPTKIKQHNKKPQQKPRKYKIHQCFLYQSNSFALHLPNIEEGLGTGSRDELGPWGGNMFKSKDSWRTSRGPG